MSNVIRTTVPLSPALVRDFFMDKTISFEIDYANSKVKGAPLITYISNLNLPCTINMDEDVSKKERFELIEAYFKSRVILEDENMALVAANILLVAKGMPLELSIDTPFIKNDEIFEFIDNNKDLLERWVIFFNSFPLFIMSLFEDLRDFFKVEEGRHVINDPDFVGRNVAKVLCVKDFVVTYLSYSQETDAVVWLEDQFKLPIFNGKALLGFIDQEKDDLLTLMKAMIVGAIPILPEEAE